MERAKRVRLSVRLLRASSMLVVSGSVLKMLATSASHWSRVATAVSFVSVMASVIFFAGVACCFVGVFLSVCPRCGMSNKDALFSFGRLLPVLEIVISGKLPLCWRCEQALSPKAAGDRRCKSEEPNRPSADGPVVVEALSRSECISVRIPRKVKSVLVLLVIAIPNLVLLTLVILHVTGVWPLW